MAKKKSHFIQEVCSLMSEDSYAFRKAHPTMPLERLISHSEEQYALDTLRQNCHYLKSTGARSTVYKDGH